MTLEDIRKVVAEETQRALGVYQKGTDDKFRIYQEHVDGKFSAVDHSLNAHRKHVDDKFSAVDRNFKAHRKHVDGQFRTYQKHVDNRFSVMERSFRVHREYIDGKFAVIAEGFQGLNDKIDQLGTDLKLEIRNVRTDYTPLGMHRSLEHRVTKLEKLEED